MPEPLEVHRLEKVPLQRRDVKFQHGMKRKIDKSDLDLGAIWTGPLDVLSPIDELVQNQSFSDKDKGWL